MFGKATQYEIEVSIGIMQMVQHPSFDIKDIIRHKVQEVVDRDKTYSPYDVNAIEISVISPDIRYKVLFKALKKTEDEWYCECVDYMIQNNCNETK